MHIDKKNKVVIFDHLFDAKRSLGSNESLKVHTAAEKAVASNAKGVFAKRSLEEIHSSAKKSAENIKEALGTH